MLPIKEQVLINYDHYKSIAHAAAANIDLQIDNLKRATGGLQLAMCDAIVQLVNAPGWKPAQQQRWMADIDSVMFSPEHIAILERLTREVYQVAEPFLSAAVVESVPQADGRDQAVIHPNTHLPNMEAL